MAETYSQAMKRYEEAKDTCKKLEDAAAGVDDTALKNQVLHVAHQYEKHARNLYR